MHFDGGFFRQDTMYIVKHSGPCAQVALFTGYRPSLGSEHWSGETKSCQCYLLFNVKIINVDHFEF